MIKSIIVGIGIFVLGFPVVSLSSSLFNSGNAETSYYYAIVFSILYLSAIVGYSTSMILKELRQNQSQ